MPSNRKGQGKSLGDLEAAVLHVLCEDEASQEQQDKDDGPRLVGEADESPASVSRLCLPGALQKNRRRFVPALESGALITQPKTFIFMQDDIKQ
jgi:hypothetical protein